MEKGEFNCICPKCLKKYKIRQSQGISRLYCVDCKKIIGRIQILFETSGNYMYCGTTTREIKIQLPPFSKY